MAFTTPLNYKCMVLSLIMLALATLYIAFAKGGIYSLEIISGSSKIIKFWDIFWIFLGIGIAVFAEQIKVPFVCWAGIAIALLGIQQEVFRDMREDSEACILDGVADAVFVPEFLIDGIPMVRIVFQQSDMCFWAVYVGEDELELHKEYEGFAVCIVYDNRGRPDYLCCE